jgi:hypothetical protein
MMWHPIAQYHITWRLKITSTTPHLRVTWRFIKKPNKILIEIPSGFICLPHVSFVIFLKNSSGYLISVQTTNTRNVVNPFLLIICASHLFFFFF